MNNYRRSTLTANQRRYLAWRKQQQLQRIENISFVALVALGTMLYVLVGSAY